MPAPTSCWPRCASSTATTSTWPLTRPGWPACCATRSRRSPLVISCPANWRIAANSGALMAGLLFAGKTIFWADSWVLNLAVHERMTPHLQPARDQQDGCQDQSGLVRDQRVKGPPARSENASLRLCRAHSCGALQALGRAGGQALGNRRAYEEGRAGSSGFSAPGAGRAGGPRLRSGPRGHSGVWPIPRLMRVGGAARCTGSGRRGYLGIGQVGVVPQDQSLALLVTKCAKSRQQSLLSGHVYPGQLAADRAARLAIGAARPVAAGPADHRAPQVGQGPVTVPQVPPCAVHARECVLGYLLGRGRVTGEQHGQPEEGTMVPGVKRGQRLVSLAPVPAAPGAPGTGC